MASPAKKEEPPCWNKNGSEYDLARSLRLTMLATNEHAHSFVCPTATNEEETSALYPISTPVATPEKPLFSGTSPSENNGNGQGYHCFRPSAPTSGEIRHRLKHNPPAPEFLRIPPPSELAAAWGLSPRQQHLFAVLYECAYGRGVVPDTQCELAARVGTNEADLRAHLRALEAAGLIAFVRDGRRSYIVVVGAWIEASARIAKRRMERIADRRPPLSLPSDTVPQGTPSRAWLPQYHTPGHGVHAQKSDMRTESVHERTTTGRKSLTHTEEAIVVALSNKGLPSSIALDLIRTHGADLCQLALAEAEKGGKRNPAGYIRQALTKGWITSSATSTRKVRQKSVEPKRCEHGSHDRSSVLLRLYGTDDAEELKEMRRCDKEARAALKRKLMATTHAGNVGENGILEELEAAQVRAIISRAPFLELEIEK